MEVKKKCLSMQNVDLVFQTIERQLLQSLKRKNRSKMLKYQMMETRQEWFWFERNTLN